MKGNVVSDVNGNHTHHYLAHGGEMGDMILKFNWESTSLGPLDSWPRSLRTTLGIMLHSGFPMFLFWGEDLVCFYNDAFRPSLGNNGKHPAIGKTGREVWSEIWDFIGPLIKKVMTTGEPVYFEDQFLPIFRNGKMEDVYWTFSYSPAYGDDGRIDGLFVTCTETTGKVIANKLLQSSNHRFKNLVAQATVGIVVVVGNEMKIEIVNEAYAKLIGRDPEKLTGQNLFDILPQSEQKFRSTLESVMATVEPFYLNEYPYSLQAKNGAPLEVYLDIAFKPFVSEQDEIIGVMVLCQDVTEKVMSRQRIERSEHRFQAAVEAVQGIVWTNNPDGKMVGEQKGWSELTGQSFEEYQGYGWGKAVHPDDAEATVKAWEEAVRLEKVFIFQHRVRTRNGEWRHFSVRAVPLKANDGTVLEWVGVHTDITEYLAAQEVIKESEERFRSLADQSPMIVYIVEPNAEATMSYFNKTWLEYTGQSFDQALGRAWDGIVHPDDVQLVFDSYAPAFKNRTSYTLPAIRLRRFDGEYRWFLFKGSPRYLPNGEFMGYVGVGIDINDQKLSEFALKKNEELLEKQVRERTSQLERSNDDLQQFAHVASHDLKEPVRKIRTFANRLRVEAFDRLTERERGYIEKVESAANRMVAMIEGVLLYSTIDSLKQNSELINLRDVIRDIQNDLEIMIRSKDATINVGEVPGFHGATLLIYQLFYNLLNNSLKFSVDGRPPVITITGRNITKSDRDFVEIELSDNGIGFDANHREIIFNTFTRLNSKDKYEGTGLGLALCKKIVERHHGTISANSRVGGGAAFHITLPVEQSDN